MCINMSAPYISANARYVTYGYRLIASVWVGKKHFCHKKWVFTKKKVLKSVDFI